ncbi:MAG: arginase family protein [bacterium]
MECDITMSLLFTATCRRVTKRCRATALQIYGALLVNLHKSNNGLVMIKESTDKIKFFGAALDALDAPEKVQLKIAYLNSRFPENAKHNHGSGQDFCDPYDALTFQLSDIFKSEKFTMAGRLPVESWLRPKPERTDLHLIAAQNFTRFIDGNGCRQHTNRLEEYIKESIFPDKPAMLGVDHSLTGGVIRALSTRYGSNLSLIVIDSHFDAIPAEIRHPAALRHAPCIMQRGAETAPCTCGDFLKCLIDEKFIEPQNLFVIGVSDYPDREKLDMNDENIKRYAEYYLDFEERGVKFIKKIEIEVENNFPANLDKFLNQIKTDNIYVSFDADIGAHRGIYAVRFLDRIGIEEDVILKIGRSIGTRRQFALAGFDVMEIDVHLLGLELPDGSRDRTSEICSGFIRNLLNINL